MHALAARPGVAGKDGGLMSGKRVLLTAMFLLTGCHDGGSGGKLSKSAEERIEREVATRVAVAEFDLKAKQNRLKTIRVIGFILLAGGALGGLIWLQRHRSYNPAQGIDLAGRRPEWTDHYAIASSRVLELPPPGPAVPLLASSALRVPPDERFENSEPRRRRRRRGRRRGNRNNNHRNHNHET